MIIRLIIARTKRKLKIHINLFDGADNAEEFSKHWEIMCNEIIDNKEYDTIDLSEATYFFVLNQSVLSKFFNAIILNGNIKTLRMTAPQRELNVSFSNQQLQLQYQYIFKSLGHLPTLTEVALFALDYSYFELYMPTWKDFCEFISVHPNLTKLILNLCKLEWLSDEGWALFFNALAVQGKINDLELAGVSQREYTSNFIAYDNFNYFCNHLSKNRTLTSLNYSATFIHNDNVNNFLEALNSNPNLKTVMLNRLVLDNTKNSPRDSNLKRLNKIYKGLFHNPHIQEIEFANPGLTSLAYSEGYVNWSESNTLHNPPLLLTHCQRNQIVNHYNFKWQCLLAVQVSGREKIYVDKDTGKCISGTMLPFALRFRIFSFLTNKNIWDKVSLKFELHKVLVNTRKESKQIAFQNNAAQNSASHKQSLTYAQNLSRDRFTKFEIKGLDDWHNCAVIDPDTRFEIEKPKERLNERLNESQYTIDAYTKIILVTDQKVGLMSAKNRQKFIESLNESHYIIYADHTIKLITDQKVGLMSAEKRKKFIESLVDSLQIVIKGLPRELRLDRWCFRINLENHNLEKWDINTWKYFFDSIVSANINREQLYFNNPNQLPYNNLRVELILSQNKLCEFDSSFWSLLNKFLKSTIVATLDLSQVGLDKLSQSNWNILIDGITNAKYPIKNLVVRNNNLAKVSLRYIKALLWTADYRGMLHDKSQKSKNSKDSKENQNSIANNEYSSFLVHDVPDAYDMFLGTVKSGFHFDLGQNSFETLSEAEWCELCSEAPKGYTISLVP